MATETDIANMALASVGGSMLTSLPDDTSVEADLCRLFYTQARDEVLEFVQPTFATKRFEANLLESTPEWEFDYQFEKPGDFLKMLETQDDQDGFEYRVERDRILSNSDALNIRYIFRLEDTSKFSSSFTRAVAFNLAAKIAYAITKDRLLARELFEAYLDAAQRSATIDSQNGSLRSVRLTTLIGDRI